LRRSPGGAEGFTLVELLVVVGIVAALMALGISGYLSLGRGFDLAGMESRLESIVRQARNSALYEGAPAGVFVTETTRAELRDPLERLEGEVFSEKKDAIVFLATGRTRPVEIPRARVVRIERVTSVRCVAFRTVGSWHLEGPDPSFGYLGRSCLIKGGEPVLGKLGGAILLDQTSGSARIVATPSPDDSADPFALPAGGRIEMWVYALGSAVDSYLVRREKSYALRLSRDGTLTAVVGGQTVETPNYALPLGRWVKVALMFSPIGVEISADDVPRGSGPGVSLDPPEKAELVFGERFAGVLDEIKVQARVEGESLDLGAGFTLAGAREIVFDSRGRLDPQVHTGPARLELSRAGKAIGFGVSLAGLIE